MLWYAYHDPTSQIHYIPLRRTPGTIGIEC